MKERWKLLLMVLIFAAVYFIPLEVDRVRSAIYESFYMLQDYAHHHILLCLVPAFFIAGALSIFISQNAVIKYFGAQTKKWISYSIASVSGSILAVCSCTVLPLFAGIYMRGAGIGPATAFLYSGPAINVLAIILTARVLGLEIGIARAVGAVVFSVIIGLCMHFIFLKEEREKAKNAQNFVLNDEEISRSPFQNIFYFALMVGILVFANWGKSESGLWLFIFTYKWYITGILFITLLVILSLWFRKSELKDWVNSTWGFTKQILPLLLGGSFNCRLPARTPRARSGNSV